jgi:ATP-dependent RNA helicase DeaD
MIFCRTKHGVDELGESLMARGFAVDTLHGDLSQVQRDRVMKRFRAGQADILIATDVAARGLDIPDVSHVINFDIPESNEAYVHRIGRTGRAGKDGTAITLVTPRESRWIRSIEKFTKARVEPKRLPSASDVNERRREVLKSLIAGVVKDEDSYSTYLQPIRDLAEEHEAIDIAAAILKLYATETGRATTEDQKLDDLATFSASTHSGGQGETGMVRLQVNIGRNFHVRPQDLVGAIANEANIPGRSIGAIDILDTYSFVDVPTDTAQRVIEALTNASVKGKSVTVEISTEPAATGRSGGGRDRGPRPGGSGGGSRGPRREYRSGGPGGQRPQGGGNHYGARRDEEGRGGRPSGGGSRPDYNRGPSSERRPAPRRDRY